MQHQGYASWLKTDTTTLISQDDDFHLSLPEPAVVVFNYNMESTLGEMLTFAEQIKQNLCVRHIILVCE